MLLLFWVGARWREDDAQTPADPQAGTSNIALPGAGLRPVGVAALATLLVVAAGPAWAAYLDYRARSDAHVIALAAPVDAGGWQRQAKQATEWRPRYLGARASVFETYSRGGQQVVLYLAVYRDQKRGGEMVNSDNRMVEMWHPLWFNSEASRRHETIGASLLPLRRSLLRSPGQRLVVWDWFVVDGQDVANPYLAKLLQARSEILGRGDHGAAIIVAAPYAESLADAERALRDFIADMRPSIDAATAKALGK